MKSDFIFHRERWLIVLYLYTKMNFTIKNVFERGDEFFVTLYDFLERSNPGIKIITVRGTITDPSWSKGTYVTMNNHKVCTIQHIDSRLRVVG